MSKELDFKKIEEMLNTKYGVENEDWAGITYKNKYFAVKSPSGASWTMFKTKQSDYFTKVALGKSTSEKLEQLQNHVILDCLITDIEGCASLEDYQKLVIEKPRLAEVMWEQISLCHNSGFEDLKKTL